MGSFLKDLKKVLSLNESPAPLMAGSKVSERNKCPGHHSVKNSTLI